MSLSDCIGLPLDINNPDDIAGLLDISKGRFSVSAFVFVSGDYQKLSNIPQASAPWN